MSPPRSTQERIKFQDIPQRILDDVLDCLKDYAAPMIGIDENAERFLGCCTFVEVGGHCFLLTATHVWEKLKGFANIGVTARRHPSPSLKIVTRLLKPIVVSQRKSDEWGPDLTFLALPQSDAENIKTYRSFWNLGKRRAMKLTPAHEIAHGAWVIIGAPEQRVQQRGDHRIFEMRASVCPAEACSERSGFDYVDLGIDTTTPNSLDSYGGMSGSGVWSVQLARNRAGQLIWQPKSLSLEGVAFYESPIVNGHRIIRCHGRKSLYCDGLDAIDASS